METNISNHKKSRVLIIGAGSAGELVINEICKNLKSEKIVIGIVDDDSDKVGKLINNIPIIGTTKDIKYIVKKYNIDEIIFSIADISKLKKLGWIPKMDLKSGLEKMYIYAKEILV